MQLPQGSGGNGTLKYSIVPTDSSNSIPNGLTLDGGRRKITGTPDTLQGPTEYSYIVTDSDRAGADSDSLTFNISVISESLPSFGSATIDNQFYAVNEANVDLDLPAATGGNGGLSYTLTPALARGLTFDASARKITGTPTEVKGSTEYTYTVTDSDMFGPDSASLTFNIQTAIESMPSFGGATIPLQVYILNENVPASAATPLPAATGGNAPLTYSIRNLHNGLTFDPTTRKIWGTPTGGFSNKNVTYGVTDSDLVDPDSDSIVFNLQVHSRNTEPHFDGMTVRDQVFFVNETVVDLQLPPGRSGNGTLKRTLTPALPAGLSFNANGERKITGTPTVIMGNTQYTYTITDSEVFTPDSATLTFDIQVTAQGCGASLWQPDHPQPDLHQGRGN